MAHFQLTLDNKYYFIYCYTSAYMLQVLLLINIYFIYLIYQNLLV